MRIRFMNPHAQSKDPCTPGPTSAASGSSPTSPPGAPFLARPLREKWDSTAAARLGFLGAATPRPLLLTLKRAAQAAPLGFA